MLLQRGAGKLSRGLYGAGVLAAGVGGTGMVYGGKQVLKPSKPAGNDSNLVRAGVNGQGRALKDASRRASADQKGYAAETAAATATGLGVGAGLGRKLPGAIGSRNVASVAAGGLAAASVHRLRSRYKAKSPSTKASVYEGRHGASKTQFRRATVPSDNRFRKALLVDLAKSVSGVSGEQLNQKERRSLADKKRVSATLSATGGVAGLTGLGLMVRRKPKAALWASTIGGGLGGTNALINTPIQRAEAKAIDPRKQKVKVLASKSMPGSLHVPRPLLPSGLRQRKTYTASSLRRTGRGMVRVKAGVR